MICPTCASPRVLQSRLRGRFERIRQRFTDKEPYRCHACGWRGWRDLDLGSPHPDVTPDDLRTARTPPPVSNSELDPLDPAEPR